MLVGIFVGSENGFSCFPAEGVMVEAIDVYG